VLRLPMLGASVPMSTFADALKVPIIGVPLANYDNNQHAANENLRLQNLWDGIDIYGGLLTDVSW
jgi:acetylornithine deacetylase/succinyl-diaminopimelate desuccinylase-like protein